VQCNPDWRGVEPSKVSQGRDCSVAAELTAGV
jgi:hypothetical protein